MNAISKLTRKRWGLRAAGLAAGALLVVLAPDSWLFVPSQQATSSAAGQGEVRWACPMFCVVMGERPGNGRCPVCGMSLQQIRDEATLNRYERFMSGVVGERLEERSLEVVLRQIGEVDYDETRLSTVTARVDGFLERVHVKETWAPVEEGQVLVEIDSPLLYAAQGDYLVAWRAAGRPEDPAAVEEERAGALRATRTRLRNLGLGAQELAELREQDTPLDPVALRAPRSGVVIRRNVVEGGGVTAGQELFTVADLSHVWILLEVFEHELPWVASGQEVELRTEILPGEILRGTVGAVDPVVDRNRRTARVRVVAENPDLVSGRRLYLPGQRIDARIHARLGRRGRVVLPDLDAEEPYGAVPPLLSIPREAVLRTGDRDVTFALYAEAAHSEQGQGDNATGRSYELDPEQLPELVGYELIELRLGPKARAVGAEETRWYYPVLGVVPRADEAALTRLRPGHVVAADGAFLLDSQSQLAGRPSLLFPEGSRDLSDDSNADR